MHQLSDHPDLPFALDIDPTAPIESWRLSVPAKGACYLLLDQAGQAIQLATTADLRGLLTRRFSDQPEEAESVSKNIDYRAIVRAVRWRPVYSRFEADWVYLRQAARHYPDQMHELTRPIRAWWVHINPETTYPRWSVSDRPATGTGCHLGPFARRGQAKKLTDTLDDLFDLCRHYDLLVQTPDATACAYKQMGKCPAPCDGTIPLERYHEQVRAAISFAADEDGSRARWLQDQQTAMQNAASELAFEKAGRLKTAISRAAEISRTSEAFAHVRLLRDHRWLILQPGSGKYKIRAFSVTTAGICFHGEIQPKQQTTQIAWLTGQVMAAFENPPIRAVGENIDQINLIAHHLLKPESNRHFLAVPEAFDASAILNRLEGLTNDTSDHAHEEHASDCQ